MTNFIITGTSGVGKTHLESELKDNYGFIQLPKYTDRPRRPDEVDGNGIGFMSREELDQREDEFFFTLYYRGYRYSWLKQDLLDNRDKNCLIAVTLESMKELVNVVPDFIPILLDIGEENLKLLEDRIKLRLHYYELDDVEKALADEDIHKRINLAKDEIKMSNEYRELVAKHNGRVFEIKDDRTLYEEVIPFILEKSLKNEVR